MAYEDLDDYSVGAAGSDTFDVVIPDLDPSTAYPIQFRWQFADKSVGLWSVSKILNTPEIARPESTNVVAVWVGTSLKVTWDAPALATSFQIYLTAGATTMSWSKAIDKSQTQQTFILSKEDNKANFGGVFQTTLTGVLKTTYIDNNTDGVAFAIPPYVDALCSATVNNADWTLTSISNGFTVAWTANSSLYPTYDYTEVYVSDSATGTYTREYAGKGPATIKVTTFATNYIKIKHISESNCSSAFSSVKTVTAYDPIVFDDIPPDPVVSPLAAWNVRDLDVSFTMPAQNLPSYVIVHLTSGTKTRSFEYPVSAAASASASVKITRSRLIDSFGDSPSSFSGGYITDLDIYRNENTTQVTIDGLATAVKPNPLSGTTTTISVTALSNGYSVSSNLNSSATGIKVYQSSTENGTYSLVASSNSSPVIVYDETNAGNTVWVKGQWTCEEGLSGLSTASSILIIDVASLSLIENPVKIKTNGSIFAGTLDANDDPVLSGARMLINKRGLFLYDSNDLNGTSPTTQIIGEDNGVTATFITQKAKIANWVVSSGKIENTLNATTGTYTGLSPSGTYAFWAGGGVAGGYSANANEDAKFSVTSAGYVKARDIHVTGGTIKVGSNFEVDTDGLVKAVNAELSGVIKASSGILGSIDIGGTIKVNGVDTVFPGQLRITVPGASGGKVEIGQLTTVLGSAVGSGIQVTNTTNGIYAQLDPVNGIIVGKGTIGGWTVNSTTISKNYTSLNSDGSITAGSGGEFTVSSAGELAATGATISGTIRASQGGFGTFSGATLSKGWTITSPSIVSTAAGANQITLNGETGVISGGTISGTKIIGSAFYIGASDSATDYFKSDGTFRFAGGKIYGTNSSLTIAAGTNIQMNIASNDDGTAGDNTVNQASNGSLTLGRAFFYGSNVNPQTGNGGSRFNNRYEFYLVTQSYQGDAAFGPGDIWMQRE